MGRLKPDGAVKGKSGDPLNDHERGNLSQEKRA